MCDKITVKNMLKGRSCDNCKFRLSEPVVTNLIISTSTTVNISTTSDIEYKETCDVLGKFPKKRCCKFWKELICNPAFGNVWTTTTTTIPMTYTSASASTIQIGQQFGGNYITAGSNNIYSSTSTNST